MTLNTYRFNKYFTDDNKKKNKLFREYKFNFEKY